MSEGKKSLVTDVKILFVGIPSDIAEKCVALMPAYNDDIEVVTFSGAAESLCRSHSRGVLLITVPQILSFVEKGEIGYLFEVFRKLFVQGQNHGCGEVIFFWNGECEDRREEQPFLEVIRYTVEHASEQPWVSRIEILPRSDWKAIVRAIIRKYNKILS